MNKRPFIVVIISSLLFVACSSQTLAPDPSPIQIQTPKPVIFDTDMAHEDMFSALFLLSHPNVDLKAITVTGTGEAHCEPGVRILLMVLKSRQVGLLPNSAHQT